MALVFLGIGGFARGGDPSNPPPPDASQPRWQIAEPGWTYEWPRDHGPHRAFKTEWWYFTGEVRAPGGRRFGYELTFFRSGLRPPGSPPVASRFVVNDLKIAHFAITDVQASSFWFAQKFSRGAFGEAGFADAAAGARLAWLEEHSLTLEADGTFHLRASAEGRQLDLQLVPAKPMVVHGENGLSRKADGPGHASHYYSGTRQRTRGTLATGGQSWSVEGESWFDHEWATNQLAPQQAGWDWFSLQFGDGTELMIYRLRARDGAVDAASSGTWIAADGTAHHLARDDWKLTPTRWWTSPRTGARYPIAWRLEIPSLALDAQIGTPVDNQELAFDPISYWEGLIDLSGRRAGKPINGHGYLELTGYAGPMVGLSAAPGP